MKVLNIQPNISFRNNPKEQKPQKSELIDKLTDAIKNPRDVNDCIAVPRGIFKAYLLIMLGTGVMAISSLLPNKFNKTKTLLNIAGWVSNTLSAWFFAKGFAFKSMGKTISIDEFKNKSNK